MAYELPPLPYPKDALEPHIDALTMEIHHGKHHVAYVTNLNKAIAGKADLEAKTLEALISNLDAVPSDIRAAVRNNGGGHANHSMFWKTIGPKAGGTPSGNLAEEIETMKVAGRRRGTPLLVRGIPQEPGETRREGKVTSEVRATRMHRPVQEFASPGLSPRLLAGIGDLFQIVEGINPGGMAIAPDRRDGVSADRIQTAELEGGRGERFLGAFIQVAQHVHLAFAASAGAGPAKPLQTDKTFAAVLPLDRQFIADVLNVHRSHGWKHTADGSPLSIFPRAMAVAMSSTSELMSDQRNVLLRDATQADPCGAAAVCHE